MPSFRQAIARAINRSLAPMGVKLTKLDHDWSDVANFIPFERTRDAAKQANLTIGDYVDEVMNRTPGSSRAAVDFMASLGVFTRPPETIVEIGPGTGRYLEKVLKRVSPARYEIYETAGPWSEYLVKEYRVTLQPTDGYTMSATATRSADLVHAHKVFSTVPFIVTCSYWHEIIRAVRPGAWAVFDVMTERCLDGDAMTTWREANIRNGSFPAAMPREVAIQFFANAGFSLAGSVVLPMPPGKTELLVFKRG